MGALASELGLNKSTVSRALSNCLIETKRGLLIPIDCLARPLNEESPERTREQVLQRLSLLIRTENKKSPYSDEELARQLANVKFRISRRTVAKYRDLLSIRGVYQRREIVRSKTPNSIVTRAESPPEV
jgi:RNA polymerase sigma-54 factor